MENVKKILKYYLEYEIDNITNSSRLNTNESYELINRIDDTDHIITSLDKLKKKKMYDELRSSINNNKTINRIIDLIKKENEQSKRDAKSLIIDSYKYSKKVELILNKLVEINDKNEFFIYAHNITLFKNRANKLPIYILKCLISNNEIMITDICVNKSSINNILATIKRRDLSEMVLEYNETIDNYTNEINNFKSSSIDDIIPILYKKLDKYLGISLQDLNTKNDMYMFNDEYIISLDVIVEDGITNIKEDIESIINITNKINSIPPLLKKYLCGSSNKNDINKIKITPYKGNYKNKYGISENQYKIVNSIKYNDLISTIGPPGTGKTSLLKEIITNNIVERTNLIVDNWNNGFECYNYYDTAYYKMNWYNNSNIIKSMVVSSKNTEAIENIINGINKDIDYITDISNNYSRSINKQKYKGLICLPLGKRENLNDFKNFLYNEFIPRIENMSFDEKIIEEYKNKCLEIKKFEEIIKPLEKINNKKYFYNINITKENFNKYLDEIKKQFQTDKKNTLLQMENLNSKFDDLKKINNKLDGKIKGLDYKIESLNTNIKKCDKVIISKLGEIKKLETRKENFNKINKNMITKLLHFKTYFKEKDINFNTLINECTHIKNMENDKNKFYLEEQTKLESSLTDLKYKHKNNTDKINQINDSLNNLNNTLSEINSIEKFNSKDDNNYWYYSSILNIYGESYLNKLNQELFLLSLKVNEQYIIKNKYEIINNLKLFLPDDKNLFICKKFYDSNNIYNDKKIDAIINIWNTLFLCFPVVTTTLDSFSKKCFNLIPEYIDLELIDEAGQIPPHNLVPAIYRAKKAIIVGDINQIEPIYGNSIKDFSYFADEINNYNDIKINGNSIQSLANKNTDLLNNKENIILNDHYRCEENIINFSNKFVYNNKLNMHIKDNMNKCFNNNMIAFDIRGKKEKEHINNLEINSCIEVIKHIRKNNNEDCSIAIITPFKRQKESIEKRLKLEKINNIKVGTVHAFQGQEKDIIIFSSVIDSGDNKNLTNFIGNKCNMLNVAVTRAKKQFIYLGNLDVAINASNYMTKLVNYITDNGIVYSLYNENEPDNIDILNILQPGLEIGNDAIGNYINNNFEHGIVVNPKNHYDLLKFSLKNVKNELYISSPWLRDSVINNNFISDIKNLINNNVLVKIVFGYRGNKKTSNLNEIIDEMKKNKNYGFVKNEENTDKIITELYNIIGSENFIYSPPTHAKILIIDNTYMCIGSHNWLSNAGIKNECNELSKITTSKESIKYVKGNCF